ncbi:MAG: major capsid protein [Janthinobacterium lividum]
MTITKLSDVIIPGTNQGQYAAGIIARKSIQKSALFRSGIITQINDEAVGLGLALEKGGKFVNVPFRNPLTGAEQMLNDNNDLVINKFTYGIEIAALNARAQVYGVTDLAVDFSKDDPMGQLTDAWSDYWVERYQVQLINVLNGALGSTGMAGNGTDVSGTSGAGGVISAGGFVAASRKLGDQSSRLVAISMHSAVMTALILQDLIVYIPGSDQGALIPTYMGKEVIEDDGMPYDPATGIATMYLFARGAIAFQEGLPKVAAEVDRASLTNGGQEWMVSRKRYLMHPRGLAWNTAATTADPTPNNAELATTTNWTPVISPKEIGIVKYRFRVA